MTVRRTLLPTALALLGAVALPAGVAHADTRTFRDAPHDVVSGPPSEDVPTTVDPGRAAEDVLAVRVRNGPRALRVTVSYAALTPATAHGAEIVHLLEVRTNEGVGAGLYLDVPRDGSKPGGEVWVSHRRAPQECRAASAHLDRRASTVTYVVPGRCLSHPRWVRVGAGAGALGPDRQWADDAFQTGRIGQDLAMGPRVRR